MPENRKEVVNVADGYSATITSGVDAEWFQVNGNGIEFIYYPDFEMPFDNDRNNEYEIQVDLTSDTHAQTQDVKIIVRYRNRDWVSGTNAVISVSGVGFDDSSIDSSTSDISLVFTFPGRFTVSSITFDGSTDLSYASDATNEWVAGTNADGDSTLTQTFTYTEMISATHEFIAGTDEYSTKWNPTVEMTEQIVVYDPSGTGAQVVMRTTTEVVSFSLTYQDSVETSTDVNIFIQQEGFIQAVHAVSLQVDDSAMDVEIMFDTIVNEPWTVITTSFDYTDDTNIVAVDSLAIEEIGTRNCVDLKCTQTFKISFDTTSCNIDGELGFTMFATWDTAIRPQNFEMQVTRDDGCVVDVGSVSLSGAMNMYDSTFTTTAATGYYLEDTMYVMATLTSTANIDSVAMSSFSASQDGSSVCDNCQANSDLNYQVIASDDASVFKYSFDLNSQLFAGALEPDGKATSISATFDIVYTGSSAPGRRRVEQVDVELRQIFSIQTEPCGKDVALGYVEKTDCESDPSSQFIRQCTKNGWEVVLDQCDEAEAVAKTEASKTPDNTLYFLSTCGLVLLIAGIAWYNQGTKSKVGPNPESTLVETSV